MYITCQKCDTVFRLDERLLKPTGSKVRCSQCGNIFIAVPPAPAVTELEPTLDDALWSEEPRTDEASGHSRTVDTGAVGIDSEPTLPPPADTGAKEALTEDNQDLDIDFDAEFDFDTLAEETPDAKSTEDVLEELELDLDFKLDDEEMGPAADADSASVPDQLEPELEVELQDLFGDSADQEPRISKPEPIHESLDDDFAQVLKNLDHKMDADVTLFVDMADTPPEPVDLESLNLELELEGSQAARESSPTASRDSEPHDLDLTLDLDQELQLDLETMESPLEASAAESVLSADKAVDAVADELNFADLDAMLEAHDDEVRVDRPEEELSLALEDDTIAPGPTAENEADVEFALELDHSYKKEHVEQPVADAASEAAADEEEIDLSDLELMLEESTAEPSQSKWNADKEAGAVPDSGEFDLSELEAAIEEVDSRPESEPAATDEEDLELALPIENAHSQPGNASQPQSGKADPALDLGDLMFEEEKAPMPEPVGGGDIELEFHVEEAPALEGIAPSAELKLETAPMETVAPALMPDLADVAATPKTREEPLEKPKPSKPAKQSHGARAAIVVVVILAAIGFGIYYAVTRMGVNIPYVSEYLKPPQQDPVGVRHLSTPEINSKFIENSQSGRLFVITGKVLNGYKEARGKIQLQGKLFTKGKKLAKTELVYAGILIDDQDLASGTLADIKKRLGTAPTLQNPDTRALPNQSLPFMVVFSELPNTGDLDEFAVEPAGSEPVR